MVATQDWHALLRQAPPRSVPETLRAVALNGARRWQVSLVGIGIFCTVIVALLFPWPIIYDIRLDFGGIAGRGVVLSSVYAKRTYGDDIVVRKQLVFSVRIRFSDAQAREHEATSLVLGYVKPGTAVDIEYLPSSPTVARLIGGFFVPGGLWEVLWGLAFLAPPLFGVWNYRRWRRSRLALLTNGISVEGHIDNVWRAPPEDDTSGRIAVSYRAGGVPCQHSMPVGREIYRRASALFDSQRPVHVLHAPDAPREYVVVELMP